MKYVFKLVSGNNFFTSAASVMEPSTNFTPAGT